MIYRLKRRVLFVFLCWKVFLWLWVFHIFSFLSLLLDLREKLSARRRNEFSQWGSLSFFWATCKASQRTAPPLPGERNNTAGKNVHWGRLDAHVINARDQSTTRLLLGGPRAGARELLHKLTSPYRGARSTGEGDKRSNTLLYSRAGPVHALHRLSRLRIIIITFIPL